MAAKKLTDVEVKERLKEAQGWTLQGGKLHRAFEWFNVWNKVVIDLNTHSVGGISELDFKLAGKINEIFGV
jgi:4a-hydroxytetrahydrobiopterin dehydratase